MDLADATLILTTEKTGYRQILTLNSSAEDVEEVGKAVSKVTVPYLISDSVCNERLNNQM